MIPANDTPEYACAFPKPTALQLDGMLTLGPYMSGDAAVGDVQYNDTREKSFPE